MLASFASMSRSKIFEKFPVALMSGSEILGASMKIFGASMWRSTIFENFTAALTSGSEIFLTAQGRILAAHRRVSGARGRR